MSLLAVDLGLKTGLARYGEDGRLTAYRSQNYGTRSRLKGAVLSEVRGHSAIVVEGDRDLARIWERAAERCGARFLTTTPEVWRPAVLLARQQRSGSDAKRHAEARAREVIAWSGLPGPTALRHDAAEAILIGLWACLELGWLAELPSL